MGQELNLNEKSCVSLSPNSVLPSHQNCLNVKKDKAYRNEKFKEYFSDINSSCKSLPCRSHKLEPNTEKRRGSIYQSSNQYLNFLSMEIVVDWRNLEALPLSLIFDKLVERIDHIYFSVVCKNWYSIAKFNYQNRQIKNNVLPMLMVPKRKCKTKRCLYGISTNTTYHFQLPVHHNNRLCGSSHGWVAKMEDKSKGTFITLLNPFKNQVSIRLPRISIPENQRRHENLQCNVHKVILSCNPTTRPHDYVVVVSYGIAGFLAFIKAGQKSWTFFNAKYWGNMDMLFYKGLVYAVGRRTGKIMGFPNDDDSLPSSGTEVFEVYKLKLDLQSGKLIQMIKLDSLGDNVLFVGDSHSVSMSASYFSNYLLKDSIYYTDDFFDEDPDCYPNGPFDMKIYNIKDGSFSEHCPFKSWFRRMPPSIWVIPPIQWD